MIRRTLVLSTLKLQCSQSVRIFTPVEPIMIQVQDNGSMTFSVDP